MAFGWAIPVGISALGSVVGAISGSKQNKNQLAWNQYNAGMQRNVDNANNKSMMKLGMMNAGMQMAAGNINAALAMRAGEINAAAEMKIAGLNSRVIKNVTAYNAGMISATAMYNDTLMEDELSMMWDAAELDMELLENQRAVERGAIEGQQAASGVIMGQDSNADVIVDQMTQEAMDTFVVRHNADREAAKIGNARAKGMWEAQVAFQQTVWQGEMESFTTMKNASIRAENILANASLQATGARANAAIGAASTMMQTQIQGQANKTSSMYNYTANMANAQNKYSSNRQSISNNFVKGLFGAAAYGAGAYFTQKPTVWPSSGSSFGGAGTTRAINYQPKYGPPQITQAGTSLA